VSQIFNENKVKNYNATFSIPEDAKLIITADITFSILNYIQRNSPCTSIEAKIHKRMLDRHRSSCYCTLARHGVAWLHYRDASVASTSCHMAVLCLSSCCSNWNYSAQDLACLPECYWFKSQLSLLTGLLDPLIGWLSAL